jgi:hypothetical protein
MFFYFRIINSFNGSKRPIIMNKYDGKRSGMKECIFILFISFLFLTPLAGCGGSSPAEKESNLDLRNNTTVYQEKIAPDHCIIVGTIFKIDTSLEKSGVNSPCSKVPCIARVRIDSVLGYGPNFPPLRLGEIIKIKFGFTLGPTTRDLFPHMTGYFPGLKENDTFKADVGKTAINYSGSNSAEYMIYAYLKK